MTSIWNAHGESQAAAVAERLAAAAGPGLAEADFVASPLKRTRRTMEILRTQLGLPPDAYRTDPRLREISFGSWEGSTWAEIRRRDPAGAAGRDRDRWHHRPPGIGGESYAALVERVGPLLKELERDTVIVAHGGVAGAALVSARASRYLHRAPARHPSGRSVDSGAQWLALGLIRCAGAVQSRLDNGMIGGL